jgi:hypothetical protein
VSGIACKRGSCSALSFKCSYSAGMPQCAKGIANRGKSLGREQRLHRSGRDSRCKPPSVRTGAARGLQSHGNHRTARSSSRGRAQTRHVFFVPIAPKAFGRMPFVSMAKKSRPRRPADKISGFSLAAQPRDGPYVCAPPIIDFWLCWELSQVTMITSSCPSVNRRSSVFSGAADVV